MRKGALPGAFALVIVLPPISHRAGKAILGIPGLARYSRKYSNVLVQTENEEPQPQVLVAFGFRITNCEPSRPSV